MADAIRVAEPPAPSPRAEPAVSLTQRASLNVIASLLDYGAKIVVGVVVIPIVVATLGSSLYGVWEMLSRLSGYLTAGESTMPRMITSLAWTSLVMVSPPATQRLRRSRLRTSAL